jgi:hypothetical protein
MTYRNNYNDHDDDNFPAEHEFEGFLMQDLPNAVLVKIDDHDYWLPKSKISMSTPKEHELVPRVTVTVPEWLAIDRGLV